MVRNCNTAREKGTYRALLRRLLPRSAVSQRGRKSNGNPSGALAGATLRRRPEVLNGD